MSISTQGHLDESPDPPNSRTANVVEGVWSEPRLWVDTLEESPKTLLDPATLKVVLSASGKV